MDGIGAEYCLCGFPGFTFYTIVCSSVLLLMRLSGVQGKPDKNCVPAIVHFKHSNHQFSLHSGLIRVNRWSYLWSMQRASACGCAAACGRRPGRLLRRGRRGPGPGPLLYFSVQLFCPLLLLAELVLLLHAYFLSYMPIQATVGLGALQQRIYDSLPAWPIFAVSPPWLFILFVNLNWIYSYSCV